MRYRIVLFAVVVALASAAWAADNKAPSSPAQLALAKFKSLAGEWEGNGAMGKSRTVFEVTAGGSVVIERFSNEEMGKDQEMITTYTVDGDRLLLTHYCVAGNQPRMAAKGIGTNGEVAFEFLDATGLAAAGAGHMHNASFRFLDNDRFSTDWRFVENGKTKFTEHTTFTRVR